jgi:SAM-dependent methyltransferase
MTDLPPGARTAPAALRNREPILEVFRRHAPAQGLVLEIAAGSGEHAVWMAGALPHLRWLPTDPDPGARASIAAWREASGLANLLPPLALDAAEDAPWSRDLGAVVCINMIHISPWSATEGLMAGAGRSLAGGGILFLYGPYLEAGGATAPSNLAFDADLRRRNPAWGLRRREEVVALAARNGLDLVERVPMPANNLSLVFAKRSEAA